MNYNEAIEIYAKHVKDMGAIYQQPNAGLSGLTRGTWYLRNSNGLLARIGTTKRKVY